MIINNQHSLDNRYGDWEEEMLVRRTISGAAGKRIPELLAEIWVATKFCGGSTCSPFTGETRHVTVDISSFIGAIGAKHWYVKLVEEDNMVWDYKEKAWIIPNRDQILLQGFQISNGSKFEIDEFTSVKQAIAWAEKTLTIFFPSHKVSDPKWMEGWEDYE